MQKQDMVDWIERWRDVTRAQTDALRRQTMQEKLEQLADLAAAAAAFPAADERDDLVVRDRWLLLKRRSL